MPVKDTCTEQFQQHIFLGLSVSEFSATAGWSQQTTEITITLVEDPCISTTGKVCYDNNLDRQIVYTADPGFVGENRYERADGSVYSACSAESISDTLIRARIDIIGLPAYFRLGDFEYTGIIVDYNKSVGSNGTTYRIKMTDPREILAGVHLIIGDYTGAVFQTGNINVYNVYGFMEQFGMPAPLLEQTSPCTYNETLGASTVDGAIFGSYSGGYGGAFVNEKGMPLELILRAFNVMANAFPVHSTVIPFVGSPDGLNAIPFVCYYGQPLPYDGCGLIAENNPIYNLSYYRVDYSELPIVGGYLNRIEGTVVSLLDIIEQAVAEAGMDYYIELLPVKNGVAIDKFIKLRVVDRRFPPTANQICSYIEGQSNVISYDIGQELRIENTGAVVIGANKQSIYQACDYTNPDGGGDNQLLSIAIDLNTKVWTNLAITGCNEIDNMILPYFGLHDNGDLIVPCIGDYGWEFTISTTELQTQLIGTIGLPPTLTINEGDLRAALSSYDAFITWISLIDSPIWQYAFDNVIPLHELLTDKQLKALGIKPVARDWVNPKKKKFRALDAAPQRKIEVDQQTIYDFYLKYARDYYGKKFAVRVPFTACWPDNESHLPIISDAPTNDGGWTQTTDVIGLTTSSLAMQFFRNEEDKIVPFVKFSNYLVESELNVKNISHLNEEQYLITTEVGNPQGALYMKAQVEEEYVFHDKSLCYAPRAIVTIEQGVYDSILDDTDVVLMFDWLKKQNGLEPGEDLSEFVIGGKEAFLAFYKPMSLPDAAAIPILSKTLTYGPFYYGGTGIPGKTNIIKDDYLAPWNYGSFSGMNSAGVYTASKGIAAMKSGELGSVTIVGYPTIPLGAELGAIDGGVYASDEYLLENRTVTVNAFSEVNFDGSTININFDTVEIIAGPWSGAFGPNITNISVNVSSNGATTTYSMRTFAPRQRFTDRRLIDRITANRLEFRRLLRNQIFNIKQKLAKKRLQVLQGREADKRGLPNGDIQKAGTPHAVFCGQIVDTGAEYSRTLVTTSKMTEVSYEMQHYYENKAFMSLDGLLRPVSMDGRGGLPRYIQPTTAVNYDLYSGTGENPCVTFTLSDLTNKVIDIDQLNPLSNPVGFNRSAVVEDRSDTPNIGHDIEVVGRTGDDDGTPVGGLIMPVAGVTSEYNGDYQDDYSTMALKGPILLQQWGYDLEDKPVPNKVDIEEDTEGGIFVDSGLTCKFLDNWLRKPKTWPVAPIDLRLDRERGVWTVKPEPSFDDILMGTACHDSTGESPILMSIEFPTFTECDGSEITTPLVYVNNYLEEPVKEGEKIIAKKTKKNGFVLIARRHPNFILYRGELAVQLTDPNEDAIVVPVMSINITDNITTLIDGNATAQNHIGGVGDAGRTVLVGWERTNDVHTLLWVDHVLFEPLVGIEIDPINNIVKGHQKYISVMTWTQTGENYITLANTVECE